MSDQQLQTEKYMISQYLKWLSDKNGKSIEANREELRALGIKRLFAQRRDHPNAPESGDQNHRKQYR